MANEEKKEVVFDVSSDHLGMIKNALYTLSLCNQKITRLESSSFYKKFKDDELVVALKFTDSCTITRNDSGNGDGVTISLRGKIVSFVPDFDQDSVDAFALTYRQLTQDNDRISIRNLSRDIYGSVWIIKEAGENFQYIRRGLNDYLDSAITLQLFDSGTISRRTLVDIILYGGLAHTDDEKEVIFRSWMGSGFSGIIWAEFFEAMLNVMRYLLVIREINSNLIKIFEPLVKELEQMVAELKSKSLASDHDR